jgi:hypothetical protein
MGYGSYMRSPKDLAEVIVNMGYRDLLEVADEIRDMNAGENEGLRDINTKYGVADTLFDWAEAVMEEVAAADEAAKVAKMAAAKAA